MTSDDLSKEYTHEMLLQSILSSAAMAGLVFSRRIPQSDFSMVKKYVLRAVYRYSMLSLCIYLLENYLITNNFYNRQNSLKFVFLRFLPTIAMFETFFITDLGDEMIHDDDDDFLSDDSDDDDFLSDDSDSESEEGSDRYNNENVVHQPLGFFAGFFEEEEDQLPDDLIEDDHLDIMYARLIYKVMTCI